MIGSGEFLGSVLIVFVGMMERIAHGSRMVLSFFRKAEGTSVEFEVEKDSNGKLKAVNVTSIGGAPLDPPKRESRRRRSNKPREVKGEKPLEEVGATSGGGSDSQSKPSRKRDPPFHDVIDDEIKAEITEKGLALVRNTVDLALGGSRIKLGQGGYASLVEASGKIGEGSFECDKNGKVTFIWERCLEFSEGKWQPGSLSTLLSSFALTDGKYAVRYRSEYFTVERTIV